MTEVILALDVPGRDAALRLVDRIGPRGTFYKVGLELFTRAGPSVVGELRDRGLRVFLDLKLHDIPTTVARAVTSAAEAGVDYLTVHASGGRAMVAAAVEAAEEGGEAAGGAGPRVLAVTVLTSLTPRGLAEIQGGPPADSVESAVLRRARLAVEAGAHGVVASPLEIGSLREVVGPDRLIVTPGIRLPGGATHDQSRVATPGAAARAGADALVVGRAVTGAADPAAALHAVLRHMEVGG